MKPQQIISKPVVIKGMQVNDSSEVLDALVDWLGSAFCAWEVHPNWNPELQFLSSGLLTIAEVGDWIIQDQHRDFFLIKSHLFDRFYEVLK